MDLHKNTLNPSLEDSLEADKKARETAKKIIEEK